MQPISFRCKSKSEPNVFYTVAVTWPGPTASCDCDGFNGDICSHIDATLIAGERFMVPEADRAKADKAMKAIAGSIEIPDDWKGSWRYSYAWRGLPTRKYKKSTSPSVTLSGKPIVCFTGAMPRKRKDLMQEAQAAGWETVDRPHQSTTIMVAADLKSQSNKIEFARKLGIPVVSYEEWASITVDGEITDEEAALVTNLGKQRTYDAE